MNIEARVSVIIPAYNAQETLGSCLEALLRQDYPRELTQIIVVDNNSEDNTSSIAGRYPVLLLHERKIQSSYAARNRGIEVANGSILVFTDADCRPKSDWLRKIIQPFHRESVAGTGGRIIDPEPTSQFERFISDTAPHRNAQKIVESHYTSIVTGNAAYRRSVLKQTAGFDQRMTTGGDIDLSWRIQHEGIGEILFVPEAIVEHSYDSSPIVLYQRFRRYGYCSTMMTALHRDDENYPETAEWQKQMVGKQIKAMGIYVASFLKRNTIGITQGLSGYERKKPAFQLLVELGALSGRLNCMWETRLFRRPPHTFRVHE